MKVTTFRIVLGFSAVILSSGAALSGDTATSTLPPGTCKVTPAQAATYHVGANARHANITQVRYTAAHAMPPARYAAASVKSTGCNFSMRKTGTVLD